MPDTSTSQRSTPMAIYKLLPNTNCKQCAESTCYSFALKLAVSQKKIVDCLPLTEPQYAEKLAALEEIVIEVPVIGAYCGSMFTVKRVKSHTFTRIFAAALVLLAIQRVFILLHS